LLSFNAGYAVMFFYIISGFLITFTLRKNYDASPNGYAQFYANRFIRIFSLYWPIAIIAFVFVRGGMTAWLSDPPLDKIAGIFLIFSDWLVTFGKSDGQYLVPSLRE
jgi:peptidoglycan/LPS O-acetylase OafA/YrhL